MRGREDEMAGTVDESALADRIGAPQHEYDIIASFRKSPHSRVRELFPSDAGM